MGHNDYMEEQLFDLLDTFVCVDCVVDPALQVSANKHLSNNTCTYCGAYSSSSIAAPFEQVMEQIYHSISKYYGDAQDLNIPYDKGWAFPETELDDILYEFDPGWRDNFREDVSNSIGYDKYWVPHSQGDWGLSDPAATLRFGWKDFTETVLHKTRFLFLSEPEDDMEYGRPDYLPVKYVLEVLGNLSTRLNLIKTIDAGISAYRVRVSKNGQQYNKFTQISVPPKGETGAGRMNPAGIPYFYIALDAETAKLETLVNQEKPYALAEMKTKRPIKVLDLSSLPDVPSIFEPEKYHERHETQFLSNFKNEISKQISKDGREHIEYIPTQIVSEYFRHRFLYDGESIDGIMFNSSKNENGANITLFISEHEEVDALMLLVSIQMY